MILIPCESATSVVCKVKIPPQMIIFHQTQRSCDNISPVNQHLCDLGSFFVFLKVFCVFHLYSAFSRNYGGCVENYDESFDNILVQIQERNLERWSDGSHAWQHAVRNISICQQAQQLLYYSWYWSCVNSCISPAVLPDILTPVLLDCSGWFWTLLRPSPVQPQLQSLRVHLTSF